MLTTHYATSGARTHHPATLLPGAMTTGTVCHPVTYDVGTLQSWMPSRHIELVDSKQPILAIDHSLVRRDSTTEPLSRDHTVLCHSLLHSCDSVRVWNTNCDPVVKNKAQEYFLWTFPVVIRAQDCSISPSPACLRRAWRHFGIPNILIINIKYPYYKKKCHIVYDAKKVQIYAIIITKPWHRANYTWPQN